MRGLRTDRVTSPRSGQIENGIDTMNERESERDITLNAVTKVEITPVKAPNDIKSAIRRQKQTETVDYLWHALPVTRSPKPLYRAVLSGSIQSGKIHYTLTNLHAAGLVAKPSDGSSIKEELFSSTNNDHNNNNYKNANINNNNNNRIATNSSTQSNGGIRVAGLSINEIKFQEPMGRASIRARMGTSKYVSRYVKPNDVDHKQTINAHRHWRSDENVDEIELDRSSQRITNASERQSNGISSPKSSQQIPPHRGSTISDRALPQSPFTVNANAGSTIDTYKNKLPSKGVASHMIKNEKNDSGIESPPMVAKESAMGRIRSDTGSKENSIPDYKTPSEASTGNTVGTVAQTKSSLKPSRRSESTLTHQKDTTKRELTCIQLADSIIGAANGDLKQVYSLCKSKLRYSDFIEQSQPHRLGETSLQTTNSSRKVDDNKATQTRDVTPSVEKQMVVRTPPQAGNASPIRSIAPVNRDTARLPGINESQKTLSQAKTPNYLNIATKYTHRKEYENNSTHYSGNVVKTEEAGLNLGKAGRPILKNIKPESDSNCKSRSTMGVDDQHIAKSVVDNAFSINNNSRLVRFNTYHEVREFTPSEPIVQ